MKRSTIVAANWKMNGSKALVKEMASALKEVRLHENVKVVVCPSYLNLGDFANEIENHHLKNIYLGAQNVNAQDKGAYTGEVSTQMLTDVDAEYVIVGHSERRALYNESSIAVAENVASVLKANLIPILCVGETEEERMTEQTQSVLASQLQPVVDTIGIDKFIDVVIAYEPVWAIGTGKTASSDMAQETHQFIRQFLANINPDVANKVPLLYGGSVNASNSDELFAQTDIDGGLIGGASLKVDEFTTICSTAKGK